LERDTTKPVHLNKDDVLDRNIQELRNKIYGTLQEIEIKFENNSKNN